MIRDELADIAVIGLAVMGRNLALNFADHGFRVAVYNRTPATTQDFVSANPDTPGGLVGCPDLRSLAAALSRPRKILFLVKEGAPVDATLESLFPLLERGDIVIDGGNSGWRDTVRREGELARRGLRFVGSGTSGGETGARFGPSLMPGGAAEAWREIEPLWKAIAAKVDERTGKPIPGAAPGRPVVGGVPCSAWIGPGGSGHYVKMVHNGIEYADMQLIAEAYFLMKQLLGANPGEMADIFEQWNQGELDSYLIEITAEVLRQRDPVDPSAWLVDRILDVAGQKGTGRWTAMDALEMGVPAPSIAEAVFARTLSAAKQERVRASAALGSPAAPYRGGREELVEDLRHALYCSKICSYAQGFALLAAARRSLSWPLNLGEIAMIWRGGCIIRARFLHDIQGAFDRDADLPNLMLAPRFAEALRSGDASWRRVISLAALSGVPCPQMMSALAYFDGYRSALLPANLIQAQRDFFGAHTFQRVDAAPDKSFHLDWTAAGRPLREV